MKQMEKCVQKTFRSGHPNSDGLASMMNQKAAVLVSWVDEAAEREMHRAAPECLHTVDAQRKLYYWCDDVKIKPMFARPSVLHISQQQS